MRRYYYNILFLTLCLAIVPSTRAGLLDKIIPNKNLTNFDVELVEKNRQLKKKITDDVVALRKSRAQNGVKLNNISRARAERELITKRLRSDGFYASTVTTSFKRLTPEDGEKDNRTIVYNVDTGPRYTIESVTYNSPVDITSATKRIDLKKGDPLLAQKVIQARRAITGYLVENSCLYEINVDLNTVVAHKSRTAKITLTVADSPSVNIRNIKIANSQNIEEDYLLNRLSIQQGDCFNRTRIDNARLRLIKTNLLTSVTADITSPDPQSNTVDVIFEVEESLSRTMEIGLGFDTDDGAGIALGWEHRNLFGRAEKLSIDSSFNQNNSNIHADLVFPHYKKNNQYLSFQVDLSDEVTDAFISKTGIVGTEIARTFNRYAKASVGLELAYSDIDDIEGKSEFTLFSVPVRADYDRRNDPLDPTKGWVAAALVQPFWDVKDPTATFVKGSIAASRYLTASETSYKPTLAFRLATGAITGAGLSGVPSNYRFFAGGGGSVRGYSFQSLSPSIDDVPIGGLSFTEISIEGRLRFGESWGAVAFVDGGMAFESSVPEFSKALRWGTGIGARFYTSFAPIRFDVAVPINRVEGEDSFQIYISIGQAF